MRVYFLIFAAAAIVFGHSPAWADDRMRAITVTGQGQVFAEPDMATVRVGVTHQDRDAEEAMVRASRGAAQVLGQLQAMGIEGRDMQTSTVSLSPVWNNRSSSSEPPRITGFVANISVTVRVRDLPMLGMVLDAVVDDGANQLGGIQFGFQDPDPLMEQARREAVADGRAKATVLADAAGVGLGALQSMSEQGGARPQAMMMEMAARDASVPIAAGEMSLSASVSMVYEIAD
jgi:uncharacterized protein YggE